MKHHTLIISISLALCSFCVPAGAATPILRPDIGIPYDWSVTLGETGTDSFTGHVGAWSWDEDTFPATTRGWTHTSNWVMVTLTASARLTVRLESQAGVPWVSPSNPDPLGLAGTNLRPSFSIYSGLDTDTDQDHTFNNRGDIAWAEDVTYLDHLDNSAAIPAERSWNLPAGAYTVSLGGNSPSTLAEGRQGYLATLSTSPIPEPSAFLLASLAAGGVVIFRRRRNG